MVTKRKKKTPVNSKEAARVKERLAEIEELFGRMPFVPQFLSRRPDIFLPYSDFSDVALFNPSHLDRKTTELAALAAGAALASEHCLNIHIDAALDAGSTEDEVLEAMMLGAFMSLTRSQAVSLRKLDDALKNRAAKK